MTTLTLEQVKTRLRLELDETHEDGDLQDLIDSAAEQLKNATSQDIGANNPLARTYMLAQIHDWYFRTDEMADTRKSALVQLQNAYPDKEE